MKIILMRLRITITMLEIRNRETLQSKVNICKSDVKIGDYADSLLDTWKYRHTCQTYEACQTELSNFNFSL